MKLYIEKLHKAKHRKLFLPVKLLINKLHIEINFRIKKKLLQKILIEANEL